MDVDEISTITINTDYAKKYEERKRNEELSKLKEKYGDVKLDSSEDESTSEEEDEFGELVTPEVDAQIMKTIAAIRSKDPKLYDSQSSFFADEEVQKARQRWTYKQQEKKSEGKPVHLKDYHRQLLLENGGVIDETDTKSETTINLKDRNRQNEDISNGEDQKVDKPEKKKVWLTTLEEEQKLKNEFNAVVSEFGFATEVEDNDDFLVQRSKTADELKAEEDEYQKFLLESMEGNNNDAEFVEQWRNYKNNPSVNEGEAFLMDYVLNRGWIDKDTTKLPSYEELVAEHGDEEQFDEAVDNFESKYNFRFEEEGSNKITTYSRNVDGSVRREAGKRKLQRKIQTERKEEKKKRKMEELKRIKNLKKKEIFDKLQKIKEITGNENVGFDEVDLEEDFDPDKYDEKMHKVFGNDYYDQAVDSKKPEWGDDIDIGDLVSGNNVVKAIEDDDSGNQYDDDFIMDADYLPGGERYDETKADLTKSEKKKLEREEKKKVKRKFDEYLDEYYQLDYEDIIGDTPVRFKYRQTKPLSFGLTPAEMLISDEKELNEYVSIKKLAPFRPEHLVENDVKKYSKKKRLQQFRKKLELLEADNPPEDKAWSIKAIKRKKQEAQNLSVKKKKNLQDEHDTSSKRKKKKKTREVTAA